MNSRCLDHFFTGNHPDDARESDSGVFTDFQEIFWVQFGRLFAELFKGEDHWVPLYPQGPNYADVAVALVRGKDERR